MKKQTMYLLGGAGVLAAGGLIYYLATKSSSGTSNQLPGGGAGGAAQLPPPTSNQQHNAPAPTPAVTTPQGYNAFLQDASNFVNTLRGIYGVSTAGIQTVTALYNNLANLVASQFQVSLPSLVPANFGLQSWPWEGLKF